MANSKKILICPLDWGLGHTTRCIPIAKKLNEQGHKITFGVDPIQKSLLQKEIEFVDYIEIKGYNIQYPRNGNMALKMLLESPKILKRIRDEHHELDRLINTHHFDLIISDNRFGMYTNKIPCIYITHQVNIQGPSILKKHLHKAHGKYINKYTKCWIPDNQTLPSLGGELSHFNLHKNCIHIGPLSRFNTKATDETSIIKYLAIISGPEPQRSEFEQTIIAEFKKSGEKCAILGGIPSSNVTKKNDNISYFSHLQSNDFYKLVCRSEKIICRSGYSSIMDLSVLQKPVHFIPTPGQTEQEYLAKLHGGKNGWSEQKKFHLSPKLQFRTISAITTNTPSLNLDFS